MVGRERKVLLGSIPGQVAHAWFRVLCVKVLVSCSNMWAWHLGTAAYGELVLALEAP